MVDLLVRRNILMTLLKNTFTDAKVPITLSSKYFLKVFAVTLNNKRETARGFHGL